MLEQRTSHVVHRHFMLLRRYAGQLGPSLAPCDVSNLLRLQTGGVASGCPQRSRHQETAKYPIRVLSFWNSSSAASEITVPGG
jgi:hypothetical protein